MPKVVNLKTMSADDFSSDALYIGRPGKLFERMRAVHPAMRDGTALGNPFRLGEYANPEECICDYRRWLDARLRPAGDDMAREGAGVRDAIGTIEAGTLLVCWCKPGPCHGDVIARAWEWLQRGRGSL